MDGAKHAYQMLTKITFVQKQTNKYKNFSNLMQNNIE